MPIRFRCPHCQQLLGISRRKAGQNVPCPTCQKEILVPSIDDPGPNTERPPASIPTEPKDPGSPHLFERSDFDRLLQGGPSQASGSPVQGEPPRPRPYPAEKPTIPRSPGFDPEIKEAPTERPGMDPTPSSSYSPVTVSIWVVILLLILASAFAIGVLVGRYL